MEKRESNYEIMKHQMQEKFASFDLDKVAREWELEEEDDYLLLTFVGREYRIDKASGAILYELDGDLQEADYNVCMTLFDILTRDRQYAGGQMMPTSSFSTVHSSAKPSGTMFDRTARRLDHRDEELAAACRRLGGVPYGKGDVAYKIPIFKDLEMVIQFWDSDEDFAPELNFFCDNRILNYMHFETMMFMLGHIMQRVCETLI